MDKLDLFKKTALESGYSQEEVDSFVSMMSVSPENSQQLYNPTGKTTAQIYAETGRQSELDEMGKRGISPDQFNAMTTNQPQAVNKPLSQMMAETGQQSTLDELGKSGVDLSKDIYSAKSSTEFGTSQPIPQGEQPTILGAAGVLGTAAGVRQSADVFSGGINYGRDIVVPNGTPVAAPSGSWVVDDVYDGQMRKGYIGDGTNSGYGNSVVLVNKETGEKMRLSHLSPGISVKPGQEVVGGTIIGATGQTGNTSGPHLDLEYYDENGRIRDIMSSPYGRSLMGE